MTHAAPVEDEARRGITYLSRVSVATAVIGISFVVLPGVAYDLFGWMIYGASGFPRAFGHDEGAYIRLAHNVMGALMAGWFVLMGWHARHVLARRVPGAWNAMIGALLLWFALDTGYSLLSGFWPNALLNVGFVLLFAPGFWLTRSLRTI